MFYFNLKCITEKAEEEDNANPANHQPPAGENHGSSTNDHDDIEDGSKSADNTALITTNKTTGVLARGNLGSSTIKLETKDN